MLCLVLPGFNEYYESVNIEILYFIYFFINFYVFRTVLLVTCIDNVVAPLFANQLMHFKSSKLGARNMSTYPSCRVACGFTLFS